MVQDPTKAMSLFRDSILSHHDIKNPLLLSMDIRKSPAEQDAALICFYKKPNVEWARPLTCRLEGSFNFMSKYLKPTLSIAFPFYYIKSSIMLQVMQPLERV